MEIVKIILLIIAYTLGVATIITQIICYRKKIEYKETLFFTVSFLLLIITITLAEFNLLVSHNSSEINNAAFYLFIIILTTTTPINVHAERIVKTAWLRNRVFIMLAIVQILLLITGYLFNFFRIIQVIIIVVLTLSILYSMLLITIAKPSLLVKHREKTERRTAKILIILTPAYILFELAFKKFFHRDSFLIDGVIIITLIFIFLAFSKFTDDLKRIALFSEKNACASDKLDHYDITQRESEVVDLLIKGKSYREIGEQLFISMPTVKTHVSNIYQKMSINNKVELINLLNN